MNTDYKLRWYHNLYPFGFHLISFLIVWLFYYGGLTMLFSATYSIFPKALLYQIGYILFFCLMYCLAYKQSFRLYPRCLLFAALIALPSLFFIEYIQIVISRTFSLSDIFLAEHVTLFTFQTIYYIVLCLAVTIGAGQRRFYRKFTKRPVIILSLVIVGLLLFYKSQYTNYDNMVASAQFFTPEHLGNIYGMAVQLYLLLGTMVQAILFPCIFLIIKYTTRPKEVAEAAKKQKAARTAETSGAAPNPEKSEIDIP